MQAVHCRLDDRKQRRGATAQRLAIETWLKKEGLITATQGGGVSPNFSRNESHKWDGLTKMRDNPSSRGFLAQLPLTLTFSDYAGTEKVSQLPGKLSTRGARSGFDPSVGDVTYYAPWGNLAIFYKDFGYAKGLVPLGVIESGVQELAALDGATTVTVEKGK